MAEPRVPRLSTYCMKILSGESTCLSFCQSIQVFPGSPELLKESCKHLGPLILPLAVLPLSPYVFLPSPVGLYMDNVGENVLWALWALLSWYVLAYYWKPLESRGRSGTLPLWGEEGLSLPFLLPSSALKMFSCHHLHSFSAFFF